VPGLHRTPAPNDLLNDRRSTNYFFFEDFLAAFLAAGFFAAFFLAAMCMYLLLRFYAPEAHHLESLITEPH
jgi:hypothetical protein